MDGRRGHAGPRPQDTGHPLTQQAAMWGTPRSVKGGHSDGNPSRAGKAKSRLEDQAHGPISSGSPASTIKSGQLNPEFVRWLMGFPAGIETLAPKYSDWQGWQDLMSSLSDEPNPTE